MFMTSKYFNICIHPIFIPAAVHASFLGFFMNCIIFHSSKGAINNIKDFLMIRALCFLFCLFTARKSITYDVSNYVICKTVNQYLRDNINVFMTRAAN